MPPYLRGSTPDLTPTNGPPANEAGPTCWREQLHQQHEHLRAAGLDRSLRAVESACGRTVRLQTPDGPREVVNFAGNDYLGLAADPRVAQAAAEAIGRWGWGAGGSRLICGHTALHEQLERALAAFKRTEAALVLPTGYVANLAAVRALAGRGDVVLLDKLDHASLIDAAAASGAEVRAFPHRNYKKLEQLLERHRAARRRVIVTDTVFSMDGDLADLPALVECKRGHDAVLLVDEAHATGVLGAAGRGLAELQGVEDQIDVTVGTLSKALGGVGGFIAGPRVLIEAIINRGRAFIFTTALPAAACAAALRALQIVQAEPCRRERALALAGLLRDRLRAAGFDSGASASQIVPVLVGEPRRAVALAETLLHGGFFVPAVRPPAVPPGGSRLRISLSAMHAEQDVEGLAERLRTIAPR